MNLPDIKKGDAVRYGKHWCLVRDVFLRSGIQIDYHNGMKIVHRIALPSKCRKIPIEEFIAHERARGNTSWNLWDSIT